MIEQDNAFDVVTIHPVFNQRYVIAEHPDGELPYLGDALGCDCMVVSAEGPWIRLYAGEGTRNEDWYSWGVDVLAPFDGLVESVHESRAINPPGHPSNEQPGSIVFLRDDGMRILYGHVQDIVVSAGQRVQSGETVGLVGNNGFCRYPHIHVGAWVDETPLQINFDLRALGRLQRDNPERYG